MEGEKIVNDLIQNNKPKEILDLKCRKGYFSILAASYGAKVEVIDDPENPEFPDYLKFHPNIVYHSCPLEEFNFQKEYDFIIVKHIVIRYEKDYVLKTLMPQVYDHLKKWWIVFVTYHFEDSYVMKQHPDYIQYEMDDFKNLKENFLIQDFWEYQNDVPFSLEKEHIRYLVLKKR